jgi:cytochrome c biogenesis protein CcmG/thiol:disulfide interchange protein DsbE
MTGESLMAETAPRSPLHRRWQLWAVLGGIGALMGLLAYGLTVDPKLVKSPLIGRPAPDFQVTRLGSGEPLKLRDLRGAPVILNFWASWCVACREEARVLQAAHERYGQGEPLVHVVGIAVQDTEEDAREFARAFGKTYYLALDAPDGTIALNYGLYGVPETFFIDAQGIIRFKTVGAVTPDGITQKVAAMTAAASTAGGQ